MGKFYGEVGYALGSVETPPGSGRFVNQMAERSYFGDLKRTARSLQEGPSVNQNVVSENTISVVADGYAFEHFHAIRYVRWAGAYWVVESVTVQRPRLLLRLGGVYNGPKVAAPSNP